MDKAIRLICRQTMVNYRFPSSYIIKETYPLPPHSTVIGMVHNMCEYTEYHDMKVSVQGSCKGRISDMYTRYSFDNGAKVDKSRHNIEIPNGKDSVYGAFRGIAHTELLCDVRLVLHIMPNKNDYKNVLNALKNPPKYPSLGRYEDLLDIEFVDEVDVSETDEIISKHNIYVSKDVINSDEDNASLPGTVYTLGKKYIIDKKSGLRIWDEKKECVCVPSGSSIFGVETDGEYPIVFI